jgi:hypothetical protein
MRRLGRNHAGEFHRSQVLAPSEAFQGLRRHFPIFCSLGQDAAWPGPGRRSHRYSARRLTGSTCPGGRHFHPRIQSFRIFGATFPVDPQRTGSVEAGRTKVALRHGRSDLRLGDLRIQDGKNHPQPGRHFPPPTSKNRSSPIRSSPVGSYATLTSALMTGWTAGTSPCGPLATKGLSADRRGLKDHGLGVLARNCRFLPHVRVGSLNECIASLALRIRSLAAGSAFSPDLRPGLASP